MRVGPLHDRIRIDAVTNGRDGMGAPKRTWAPLWEAAAQIDTYNGREYFTGTREESADYVRIRMRYHPKAVNITSECRAVDVRRGITYAISSVLFDDKRTLLTLACVSGVSDG
jgi:head-tail adaptor